MHPRSATQPAGPALLPGRRAVLRGGLWAVTGTALTVLSGCGIDPGDIRWDDDTPPPTPTPGPDELARRRAVDAAQTLLSACAAAVGARPQARAVLDAVAQQHSEHLVALGVQPQQTPPESTTSPPETATPTGAPTTATGAPTTPTNPTPGTDVLADLVAQHTAAASQAMTDTATTSGPLARLLAQIAAARAVQARQLAGAFGQPAPADPAPLPSSAPSSAPSSGTASPSGSTSASPSSAPPGAPVTDSGSPSPIPLGDDGIEAVSKALEGEYAAVYGYEALAVRLTDAARERALAAIGSHENVIDHLETVLQRAGADPPAAAPAYRLPSPLANAAQAMALAARLESSLAALDADMVAVTGGELRAVAVDLLLQRALAAVSWGAEPTAFPGS